MLLRSLLALGTLVAFYVFALAAVFGLLGFTWLELQFFERGGVSSVALMAVPPLAAIAILVALMPRTRQWRDPGPAFDPRKAADLFALLREVACTTGQRMPRKVYLVNEMNAWVIDRGFVSGRVMALALPLFDQLTVSELRAIVAHEFGHYAAGHTGLGTWVYRAVRKIETATAVAGAVPILDGVFELWAEVFLRLAMPIARQHELAADELACRVAGPEALISALAKFNRGPHGEIASPVAGWEPNLHETHPPLHARMALAANYPPVPTGSQDDRPASVLLRPRASTAAEPAAVVPAVAA
jgi:Zn-dependent protease with chaperone function